MTTLAIIQARLGSVRLPGKILRKIKGKAILEYVKERVECSVVDATVIAMPMRDRVAEVEEIVGWGGEYIDCPEDDVATRFREVLERSTPRYFVRICGDSPLIDPTLINAAVVLAETTGAKMVSNPGYPHGQQVEVIDRQYFLDHEPEVTHLGCREHAALPCLYQMAKPGDWLTLHPNRDRHFDTSLAVDTEEDFARVKKVFEAMTRPHYTYGYMECLKLSRRA